MTAKPDFVSAMTSKPDEPADVGFQERLDDLVQKHRLELVQLMDKFQDDLKDLRTRPVKLHDKDDDKTDGQSSEAFSESDAEEDSCYSSECSDEEDDDGRRGSTTSSRDGAANVRGNKPFLSRAGSMGLESNASLGTSDDKKDLRMSFGTSFSFASLHGLSTHLRWARIVAQVIGSMENQALEQHQVWKKPDVWMRDIRLKHRYVDLWQDVGREKYPDPARCSILASTENDGRRRQRSDWLSRFSSVAFAVRIAACRRKFRELARDGPTAFLENNIVVEPGSPLRICWAILGLFLVLYDMIMLPFQAFDPPREDFLEVMWWVSQLFWSIDIPFTFLTAVYKGYELNYNLKVIARAYSTSWLVFDIIVTVPAWVVYLMGGEEEDGMSGSVSYIRMAKYARMLRFLRILRIAKLERILGEVLMQLHSQGMHILVGMAKLMIGMILVSHVNACAWYWLGKGEEGWASQVDARDIFYRYLTSMHWALTQFQGTSDILPGRSLAERGYAVCTVLTSLLIFCMFLTHMTNKVLMLQSISAERNAERQNIRAFLQENKLSRTLSTRLIKYVDFKATMRRQVDVKPILHTQLLMDVEQELRTPLLSRHCFFERFCEVYPRLSRRMCHEILMESVRATDDVIFSLSELSSKMYFVQFGMLNYMVSTRKSGGNGLEFENVGEQKLGEGAFISEPCLWMDWQHRGDLQVTQHASLIAIAWEEFAMLIQTHPPALASCCLYANRYVRALQRFGVLCSDLIDPYFLIPRDLPITPKNSRSSLQRRNSGSSTASSSFDDMGMMSSFSGTYSEKPYGGNNRNSFEKHAGSFESTTDSTVGQMSSKDWKEDSPPAENPSRKPGRGDGPQAKPTISPALAALLGATFQDTRTTTQNAKPRRKRKKKSVREHPAPNADDDGTNSASGAKRIVDSVVV